MAKSAMKGNALRIVWVFVVAIAMSAAPAIAKSKAVKLLSAVMSAVEQLDLGADDETTSAAEHKDDHVTARKQIAKASEALLEAENELLADEAEAKQVLNRFGNADEVEREIRKKENALGQSLPGVDISCVRRAEDASAVSSTNCPSVDGILAQARLQLDFLDSCSDVSVAVTDKESVSLGGMVGTLQDQLLLRGLFGESAVGDVKIRLWPVCNAFQKLRRPLSAPQAPVIRMLEGRQFLKIDDSLAFRVTAPEFQAYLYVMYLQADGTVVNLLPRSGDRYRRKTSPGTTLVFGDGKNGRPRYSAAPPAGAEAVIVLASRSPIRILEDIEDPVSGEYRLPWRGNMDANPTDQVRFFKMLHQEISRMNKATRQDQHIAASIAYLTIAE